VFLRYGAEQECSGYLFVLGVLPARPKPEKTAPFSTGSPIRDHPPTDRPVQYHHWWSHCPL